MFLDLLVSSDEQLEFSFFENGSDAVVTSQVAYNAELDITYSTFCSLSPTVGAEVGTFELTFSIVEYEHYTDYEYVINDGLETKNKIADADQRAIFMSAILCSVEILLEKISPNVVNMITYNENLPDKALKKYTDILSVFYKNGYAGGATDPYHGRTCWLMQKISR